MSLDDLCNSSSISATTQAKIINDIWPRSSTTRLQKDDLDWNAFFSYYTDACTHTLHDHGQHISIRTHRDVCAIAQQLAASRSKEEIKEGLRTQLTDRARAREDEDRMLEGSVNLAARILAMMDFGTLEMGFSGRSQIAWADESLKCRVHSYFNVSPDCSAEGLRLEGTFTARNIEHIAGIEVAWTNNLADHLKLVEDDKKVRIFHHASFLKWQQSQIFPDGLIEETLATLALLVPQSDPKTQKWIRPLTKSAENSFCLDKYLLKCGQLRTDNRQFENFRFWHDRLVILKKVFDHSRPKTLSQWWHDRRNGVQ
ncbi:hypothetical protein P154DRAFT_625433 [Amniculicola lignicola CBS 123094]|uniref:Uncharacterized protein n=1 Tax=Amniculicola lignicola CBS 123094 TaxID=1392246 RepID=A0A6A5VWT1_9PLEO|nr:hypothetical protein P154DRAFT_625433 [Amniculicola lignicola CBS 123094]